MTETSGVSEITHRGVKWRRDETGRISFYDSDGKRWVGWVHGVDAPPLPPGWGPHPRVERPGRWTRWRLIPVVLTVVAVAIAIIQVIRPPGDPVAKEAKASAGMLGECLAQQGSAGGHPRYSSTAVACGSRTAAVKVVAVIPTTPGSPLCPAGTTGMELLYNGVRYPHVECTRPLRPAG